MKPDTVRIFYSTIDGHGRRTGATYVVNVSYNGGPMRAVGIVRQERRASARRQGRTMWVAYAGTKATRSSERAADKTRNGAATKLAVLERRTDDGR